MYPIEAKKMKEIIGISKHQVPELVLQYARRSDSVLISSPWISSEHAESLRRTLTGHTSTVLTMEDEKNTEAIGILADVAEPYQGPVHAKLYIFERHGYPFASVFGSGNLTCSRFQELVLICHDSSLNNELVKRFFSFRNRCRRWK